MFFGSKMVSARAKAALDLNAERMGTMNPLAAHTIVTQHSQSHTRHSMAIQREFSNRIEYSIFDLLFSTSQYVRSVAVCQNNTDAYEC